MFSSENTKVIFILIFMICLNLFCISCSEDIERRPDNIEDDNDDDDDDTDDDDTDDDNISACPTDKAEPHYGSVDNQCLPSCGQAANLAGYGGYGTDGQSYTSDDPHIYSKDATSCENLEAFNHNDWKDFTFKEKFSTRSQSNDQIKEVARHGGVCCVRGESQNIDDDGDDDDDSSEDDNFLERVENAPNMKHIVDRLAEQCPVIMQAVWSESKGSWSDDLRFLDLTVEALREEDRRWGYTFWTRTGYADSWSTDRIGYFHGTGNPYNSTDITVIDYLAPKEEDGKWVYYPSWYNATQELKENYPDATGYWRYPRHGANVSLSDCTGNVDTNDDLVSCGSAANLAGYGGYGADGQSYTFDDPHIYSTRATSCENLEILNHDDWKDFTFKATSNSASQSNDQVREVVQSGGVCCIRETETSTTPSTTHPPVTRIGTEPGQCEVPNKFAVLQQLAADESDLLTSSNNCPPHFRNGGTYEFLETVLVELRKTDTRWGYYHRTQHNLQHASSDAISYYCGEGNGNGSSDLRFVDVITSSCQVSWQDSLEGHAARARPENGYWKYPRQ